MLEWASPSAPWTNAVAWAEDGDSTVGYVEEDGGEIPGRAV